MARVRKLGRRTLERGAIFSDEPALRELQFRFLGAFGGIAFLFTTLAYRKLVYLFGLVPVVIGTVLLIGGVIALIVKTRRTGPIVEPKDEELDIVDTELDEQIVRGVVQPMDLVFERGRWITLQESVRFAEPCEGPVARQQRVKQIIMAGYVSMGLAVFAGLCIFVLNFGRFFHWLSDVG